MATLPCNYSISLNKQILNMRKLILLSVLSISFLLSACSSVGSVAEKSRPQDSVSDDKNYYQSLADYLGKIPGVHVQGSGNNAYVTIRGISSFNSTNAPLYVIDGNSVGHSYTKANSMLDPSYIDYVQVLKGPDATLYGVRGANGVILIATRKI